MALLTHIMPKTNPVSDPQRPAKKRKKASGTKIPYQRQLTDKRREQNRAAQRIYRERQRIRIEALEAIARERLGTADSSEGEGHVARAKGIEPQDVLASVSVAPSTNVGRINHDAPTTPPIPNFNHSKHTSDYHLPISSPLATELKSKVVAITGTRAPSFDGGQIPFSDPSVMIGWPHLTSLTDDALLSPPTSDFDLGSRIWPRPTSPHSKPYTLPSPPINPPEWLTPTTSYSPYTNHLHLTLYTNTLALHSIAQMISTSSRVKVMAMAGIHYTPPPSPNIGPLGPFASPFFCPRLSALCLDPETADFECTPANTDIPLTPETLPLFTPISSDPSTALLDHYTSHTPHIPPSLLPHSIQLTLSHPGILDCIIFPLFRSRVIKAWVSGALSTLQLEEFWRDWVQEGGVICWVRGGPGKGRGRGGEWDTRSWEIRPWFLRKWQWIFFPSSLITDQQEVTPSEQETIPSPHNTTSLNEEDDDGVRKDLEEGKQAYNEVLEASSWWWNLRGEEDMEGE